jgi:hypothetical protein
LGYPVVEYAGLMSNNKVVKSPTSVAVVPTLVLPPFVLRRTCNRSGNMGASTVRVQKPNTVPFCTRAGGVKSQSLKVEFPVPLLKLAAIYESLAPPWAGKTALLPWNHPVVPGPGMLLFCIDHPLGKRFVMSPNNCEYALHPIGVGAGDGVGGGVGPGGVAVGVETGGVGVAVGVQLTHGVDVGVGLETEIQLLVPVM